jgi:hypothetical protein
MLGFALLRKARFTLAVVGTFAVAFVAYEGLTFVTSLGHHEGDYRLAIVLYLLYLNGLFFAGLLALQALGEAVGVAVPRAIGQSAGAPASAPS